MKQYLDLERWRGWLEDRQRGESNEVSECTHRGLEMLEELLISFLIR